MGAITTLTNCAPVPGGASAVYTGQFLDQNDQDIILSDLNTLTLSIADPATNAIINGVSQEDILNAGRGTVNASGQLTLVLGPGDTTVRQAAGAGTVKRSLVFDFTYDSGDMTGRHQVDFFIQPLAGP